MVAMTFVWFALFGIYVAYAILKEIRYGVVWRTYYEHIPEDPRPGARYWNGRKMTEKDRKILGGI